jgi:hypothetical protein
MRTMRGQGRGPARTGAARSNELSNVRIPQPICCQIHTIMDPGMLEEGNGHGDGETGHGRGG